MTDKKLAIVATTINPSNLNDFLKSVKEQENKNFHLFLVNVNEKELTLKNSDSMTILNIKNKGYADGLNQGIKKAIDLGFSKFCVINDDVFFEEYFVTKALNSLDEHPSSLIGGKIYYASGYEYHKSRYTAGELGKVIWYAGGAFDWDHVLSKHIGVDEVDTGQFDQLKETEFITGALMLFDKEVIDRVGFWDSSFFLYFEDADFCVRAGKKGLKLYYDPSLVIWHKVSQSTGGSGSELHVKFQTKNRLRFGMKYAPLRTKLHLLKNFFLESFSKK